LRWERRAPISARDLSAPAQGLGWALVEENVGPFQLGVFIRDAQMTQT